MLSSSSEYLMALRERDFLQFLEWPTFIAKKYGRGEHPLSGDALLDCLIFEWLNYGYHDEDIEHMAILYAVYELNPSLLHTGASMYQLMTTISALFSCIAFHTLNLYDESFPDALMNEQDIFNFMDEKIKLIGEGIFNESISLIRDDFLKYSSQLNKSQVLSMCKKIDDITLPLLILEKYKNALYLYQGNERRNSLCCTRLGTVQSFLAYLQDQTELTEKVRTRIAEYARLIRAQQPVDWEEEYLQKISPYSLTEKSWKAFAYLSVGFFTMVMPKEGVETQVDAGRTPRIG